MEILVVYGTLSGSTRSIAENLRGFLGEHHQVTVGAMTDTSDLSPFGAFVIGSAIYAQAWLPDAHRFMVGNTAELAAKPVWMFGVTMPTRLPGPLQRRATRKLAARLASTVPAGIRPREVQLFFGGHFADDPRPRTPPPTDVKFGDFRDWPRIRAWADQIDRALTAGGDELGRGTPN